MRCKRPASVTRVDSESHHCRNSSKERPRHFCFSTGLDELGSDLRTFKFVSYTVPLTSPSAVAAEVTFSGRLDFRGVKQTMGIPFTRSVASDTSVYSSSEIRCWVGCMCNFLAGASDGSDIVSSSCDARRLAPRCSVREIALRRSRLVSFGYWQLNDTHACSVGLKALARSRSNGSILRGSRRASSCDVSSGIKRGASHLSAVLLHRRNQSQLV